MKRNWTCPRCSLVFSRKWNLQRHFKLMHVVNENFENRGGELFTYDNKLTSHNALSFIQETTKQLSDFANLLDKISNSRQASNYKSSLEWQVNSLRQQLASCEKRFSDLIMHNLLIPKGAIQGISGYICKKCQTFSLKGIFDIGYDRTMETKHRCADTPDKAGYFLFKVPSDTPNVDDWAARSLLDVVNSRIPIGKYLIAGDITERLNNLKYKLTPNLAMEFLGIPDKFHFHSFENNFKVSWIDRAIDNPENVIAMTDEEALDFFRRVKSTYAIFEVPIGETVRQFFMHFTNNWELKSIN